MATTENKKEVSPSISYSGKVNIKVYDMKKKKILSSKTIKNHGTINLFKFLCSCLINQYESNNRPRYLDASASLIETSNATKINNFNSCLYYKSILNNSNLLHQELETITTEEGERLSENYYCKFSATILKGQLIGYEDEYSIKSLVLSNSQSKYDNTNSILAWINLKEGEEISIGDSQAILIEWELSFNNYVTNAISEI